MTPKKAISKTKQGAALIVALWVLVILSLIVGSFAFEVHLEGILVSHKRKKFHAEMLAYSGQEYARAILDQQQNAKELEIESMPEDPDGFMQSALYVKRGLSSTSTLEMESGGSFTVTIESAEGRLNINILGREDWLDIFEMANIPSTDWDAMIDCLEDWIDEGDTHQLNGAESDDPFYEELGYPVKNGPLDSVEELLLIKNWGPDILYGKPADEDSDETFAIGELLTVWGDGRINLNTATIDTLRAAGLTDEEIAQILEDRMGPDGEEGTLDDGLPPDYAAGDSRFKLQSNFVKVTSVGEIFGNLYQIECIYLLSSKNSVVVYWNEGPVKEHKNTRQDHDGGLPY
jgi:general secretion pathway protein K